MIDGALDVMVYDEVHTLTAGDLVVLTLAPPTPSLLRTGAARTCSPVSLARR